MPLPAPAASPVADAYARLTEAHPYLRVTELSPAADAPQGDGWVSAARLAEGGADLDAFLAWDDEQVLRDYGRKGRPDVIASFGLRRYAWAACLLFTVPWFLSRRVPRLPAEHVSVHRTEGRIAVRVGTFACLPDDPAASLPGARAVPDDESLRAEVRAAVAEHVEPVLGGFGPRTRRRGRALWGMATDEVVEGIRYLARLLGEEERAQRELALLLPGATEPYVGSAAFREGTGPGGESLPTRDRVSCCMFYTLRPEDACPGCPRVRGAERDAKLTAVAVG